jgi:hypothetical protein
MPQLTLAIDTDNFKGMTSQESATQEAPVRAEPHSTLFVSHLFLALDLSF